MSGVKLTNLQRESLEWLKGQAEKFPQNQYGFNPTWRRREAACCRRSLSGMGLVHLNHVQPGHIRYSITPSGLQALQSSLTPTPT